MNSPEFPSDEYRFLEEIKKYCNFSPDDRYILGIGDDAAIRSCDTNEQLALTGDTLIENVHFSLEYMSLEEVGYKALVANISDCAAMGTVPDSALIQVGFPENSENIEKNITMLYKGFNKACIQWKFPIIGGDLSKGPCWMIAVSLVGRKESQARILMRTGALAGDDIWVSGIPGRSAAGLAVLKKWGRERYPEEYRDLVEAHISPQARIDLGLQLADNKDVHAVIDLSDGISKECYTLCHENKVGMLLNPPKVCTIPAIEKLSETLQIPWYEWFLYGGEDYELLFTASEEFDSSFIEKGIRLYNIGSVTDKQNEVSLIDFNGRSIVIEKNGWDHLKQ